MSLSRKMLEGMGITAEQIESIIEAHTETVSALKKERDEYKAKLDGVDLTKDWKGLYEKEHTDFDAYRTEQQKRETRSAKEAALRAVYAEAGISERFIPALLRIADYDALELGDDGKAKNHKDLVKAAKTENAEFIPKVEIASHNPATPPAAGGTTKMTREEIMAIRDTAERQQAIKDNIELFVKG